MSKEKELLREIMRYIASGVVSITSNDLGDAAETLHEIQELLAQPEQEQDPVAWMWKKHTAGGWLDVVSIDKPTANAHQINIRPLYYTAPQKREPLTDENVCEILLKKEWKGFVDLVRQIEKEHGIEGGDE